jgi:hypothetical protein
MLWSANSVKLSLRHWSVVAAKRDYLIKGFLHSFSVLGLIIFVEKLAEFYWLVGFNNFSELPHLGEFSRGPIPGCIIISVKVDGKDTTSDSARSNEAVLRAPWTVASNSAHTLGEKERRWPKCKTHYCEKEKT